MAPSRKARLDTRCAVMIQRAPVSAARSTARTTLTMRAATAQIAIERRSDFHLGRAGDLTEQSRGGHHDPARAVAALRDLFGDERGLERMERLGRAKTF